MGDEFSGWQAKDFFIIIIIQQRRQLKGNKTTKQQKSQLGTAPIKGKE